MVLAHRLTFWADAIPIELKLILGIEALIYAQARSELYTYTTHFGYKGFAKVRSQLQELSQD